MLTPVKDLMPGQFFKLRTGAVYIARNKVIKSGDNKLRLVWRITNGGMVQKGYVACKHHASTTVSPGMLFNVETDLPVNSDTVETHKLYWHDFDTPAEIFSAISVTVGGKAIRVVYKHHPKVGHITCFDRHSRKMMAGYVYTVSLVRSPTDVDIWSY